MPVPVFTVGEVLTAANMNRVGLWLIKTQTFTNTNNVDVVDVFSSDFQNYKVTITAHGSGSVLRSLRLRYRNSGGVAQNNDYYTKGWYNFGTLTGYAPAAQNHFYVGDVFNNSQYPGHYEIDIFNPNAASRTAAVSSGVETFNTYVYGFNNTHAVATAYTGLNLTPDNDNITGTIRVYGYRN